MTEKTSEYQLRTILNKNNFNKEFLFDSPSNNEILKELFKNSSKNNSGNNGIPDCIFFNNETLIIMECKSNNLNFAELDYLHYYNFVKETDYKIYGICFVNKNNYNIYEKENKIKKLINLESFNLNINFNIYINMDSEKKKIHNYIRDNTKISNEDKPFFIACCFIFLMDLNNKLVLDTLKDKNIYELICRTLEKYKIDYSIFDFMKNDTNNIYLFSIVKMINDLYNKNPSKDLLNEFYMEFVRYNNTDSKSLGICLTPDYCVSLMCFLLDINENDIVLDLCTGTGSFLLKANKYDPKLLIGCEYQNKLFQLLKINIIIRNLSEKTELIHDNCFYHNFKATKSIINPPYGMTGKESELNFILKQLESLEENGLCCAIIPMSKLNNNKNLNKFKKEIVEQAKIKCIIKCNPDLFKPVASVHCCIILFEKNKLGHDFENDFVNFIDYNEDYLKTIIHNGKIKSKEFYDKFNSIKSEIKIPKNLIKISSINSDWCYEDTKKVKPDNILRNIFLNNLKIKMTEEYKKNIKLLDKIQTDFNKVKFKEFKISDLFEILKKPKEKFENNQKVPLICAKNNNNGVKEYIDSNENTFNGNKIVLITGGNGGAGLAFYQENPFNITSSTCVLSPKFNMNKNSGLFISLLLSIYKEKYNFTFQWNQSRINNDILFLPIDEENEIDNKFIIEFLKTIKIKNNENYLKFLNNNIKFLELKNFLETINIFSNFHIQEYENYKITDLFDIIIPKKTKKIYNTNNGNFPLISSSKFNNGIVKLIDTFDYDYEKNILTLATNGSIGSCFIHIGKISVSSDIYILEPKQEMALEQLEYFTKFIFELSNKYSYNNKLKIDKLKKEIIFIPKF